jgi:threonine dehydrogenase-like Zn-dependent dehydrogenase
VDELTAGRGADLVIEASGNIQVLNGLVYCTRRGGAMALIGFYEAELSGFNIDYLVVNNIRLHGTMGEYGTPKKIIGLLRQKRLSLLPLVSGRIPFAGLPRLLLNGAAGRVRDIKVLVEL